MRRQTKLNQFNARMLNVALGDPAVCAATPGCVPLNIFGEGSMTPEMLDFVTYTGVDTSSQKLVDVTANLSGDLFDLPAGALGFAVGYEHREEDGNFIPDPVRRGRRDRGRADQPDRGRLRRGRVLRRGDRADPEGPDRLRLAVAERRGALLGFGPVR